MMALFVKLLKILLNYLKKKKQSQLNIAYFTHFQKNVNSKKKNGG